MALDKSLKSNHNQGIEQMTGSYIRAILLNTSDNKKEAHYVRLLFPNLLSPYTEVKDSSQCGGIANLDENLQSC